MPYIKYNYEEIINGINRALVLRDRYTVLFYLRDKGMLERYADYAANKLLEVINND